MATYFTDNNLTLKYDTISFSPTYSQSKISYNPVYKSFTNINGDELNILKGFKRSIELTLIFLQDNSNYESIPKLISLINYLRISQSEGIQGFGGEVFVNIDTIASLVFDKVDSDISVSDYIANNRNIGHEIKIKLSYGRIEDSLPCWSDSEGFYTDVLHQAQYTRAGV